MTRRRETSFVIALLVACGPACVGPRAPRASGPTYGVRLLGASDGALRGGIRGGQRVFTGSAGRDYAIEITNDTPSAVGLTIVVDGLDAKTGEPVVSCERLGGWSLPGDGRAIIRGFSVSDTRIATYRFAPRDQSLAAIARGGRREAIGTIEVCFFSLRPRTEPVFEGPTTFGGVVESEPSPAEPRIVGELRDEPRVRSAAIEVEDDELLTRIVVRYEDEDGVALGTAPPPAGIARVAPPGRDEPPAAPDVESMPTQETTKPTKPIKPPKPTKATTNGVR